MSYVDAARGPSWRLWCLAAVAALALHLGGAALAVGTLKAGSTDEGLAAAGAEIAVELEAPKAPDQDLPPGPDVDAQQASQQQVKQEAELKESELPTDKPVESEDPDRVVSEKNSTKPKEEDPKVAAVPVETSEARDAQVATAPQQFDEPARESDRPKAPNIGIGKDKKKLTEEWNRKIGAYFEQNLRYPDNKRKDAIVKLDIVLNRLGHVVSVVVAETSGDASFDNAALAMVHRSDPVPAPPADLTADTFSFRLPVQFNLKSRRKS